MNSCGLSSKCTETSWSSSRIANPNADKPQSDACLTACRVSKRPPKGGSEGVTRSVGDVLRSVNGTASKCKTFLATATKECCPARGTLAGHFTRRLSPSPMPGKRIQQQRAYLPLKRSSPRPQFYRALRIPAPPSPVRRRRMNEGFEGFTPGGDC